MLNKTPRTTDELLNKHAEDDAVTIIQAGATTEEAQAVTGPRILIGDAIDAAWPDPKCTYWIPAGADEEAPQRASRFHRVHKGRAHLLAVCGDEKRFGNNVLNPVGPVTGGDPLSLAKKLAQHMGAKQTRMVGDVKRPQPTPTPTPAPGSPGSAEAPEKTGGK